MLDHQFREKIIFKVSLYDIYLEVCPSRWTGIDTLPDARYPDEDEFEELEEDPEVFTRKTTSSIRRFRLVFQTKFVNIELH